MKQDMMKRLMGKKDKPKLSDVEKEAKLKVLNSLKSDMEGMMGEGLKGLKKVTVASDSPEGLQQGLEKAEELVEGHEMESQEEESLEEEPSLLGSSLESSEMSEEELDQKLNELMQLKEKMKAKA